MPTIYAAKSLYLLYLEVENARIFTSEREYLRSTRLRFIIEVSRCLLSLFTFAPQGIYFDKPFFPFGVGQIFNHSDQGVFCRTNSAEFKYVSL